ncbi:PPE domain-containing protein, partial [Mycobacterium tuberculosis]
MPTTLNARDQPPAEVSDQRVSGLTGAVHYAGAGSGPLFMAAAAWEGLAADLRASAS